MAINKANGMKMTQSKWLALPAPYDLLAYLRDTHRCTRTWAGRRKLRLFGCAVCWRVYEVHGPDDECRRLIEDAETIVDGRTGVTADQTRFRALPKPNSDDARGSLVYAARLARLSDIWAASNQLSVFAVGALLIGDDEHEIRTEEESLRYHDNLFLKMTAEEDLHADFLRCIFGSPFYPVACDPSWRTSTAVGLAEAIYTERAFDRLPILADALEDAGCDDPDVLAHCRSDGPHARGCWVVDLILGKA